jgi:micrococcal nuclease
VFQYEAKILRLIDGDTMKLDIDLGFYVRTIQTVRLAGINTPETVTYKVSGIVDPALNYIREHTPEGMMVVAEISRQEKYGRWLARILYRAGARDRVELLQDPHVLNDELVRAGLAVNYSGGKR